MLSLGQPLYPSCCAVSHSVVFSSDFCAALYIDILGCKFVKLSVNIIDVYINIDDFYWFRAF
jgi:hypothetical protein